MYCPRSNGENMTSRLAVAVLLISLVPACKSIKDLAAQGAEAGATTPSVVADTKITEVTFARKVPKVGTKVDTATKTAFKFTFEGKIYRESSEDAAQVTVQGSDEFRVTKASIEVKQLYTTKQEGTGDEKKSVNPLAGSRFIVSRSDDGKLTALDSGGAKVIPLQLAQIQEHFATVFDADKTQEFLPKRPVKIGEKLIPSSDAVLKLLGQKDDGNTTIDGVEFILQSATPELATFAVTMTFTQKINPKVRLRAKLEGTLDVRPKDSAITSIDVKGPLNLLDPGGNDKGTETFL
ncbi:MAG: hypothetical protein JWM74_4971 [Myxococcaceae bacterium]|nr:hypothetical protein [Myxococcaceae bacterium]